MKFFFHFQREARYKSMTMIKTPLTNVQLEILELYSTELTEEDLQELKRILAHFYAKRAIQEADRIWDERGLTNDDMEQWLNE